MRSNRSNNRSNNYNPTSPGTLSHARRGPLASLYLSGSGGTRDSYFGDSTGTSTFELVLPLPSEDKQQYRPLPDTAEMLSVIREVFALNVSQLAEVLLVSRPTMYSWLASEARPQRTNLERLREIYDLADRIGISLASEGFRNRAESIADTRLLNLLKEQRVDADAVKAEMRKRVTSSPKQTTGLGLRARAQAQGATEVGNSASVIDVLTGQRIAPEPDDG